MRPRCHRALWCLVVLAASAPVTADDATDAATPTAVREYRFKTYALSVSWKDGLHYGVDVPDVPASLEQSDLRWWPLVRGDFGLRLSIDAAGVRTAGHFVDLEDEVAVRRGYFYMNGSLAKAWKPLTYKFEIGTVNDRFSLRNASFSIHELPYAGTLTLGTFDAPMTLSYLTSSRATPLMESGMIIDAFAPGTGSGLQFADWLAPQRLTWAFGFFSEASDADVGDASKTPARFVGRTTWLPWRADERNFVHVGFGVSWAFSPSEHIRFRSRPESFLAPYVVDTGTLDGRQTVAAGPEAVWMRDRVSVQGETLLTTVLRDSSADPLFGGFYVMASWFLTSDARAYDESAAAFTSLVPSRPLSWRARQLGAFEVAARWSYIDLDDAGVHGGRATEVMSGLNWYWNRYVRMQLNVGWAGVSGGPRAGADYLVLQARLDLQL